MKTFSLTESVGAALGANFMAELTHEDLTQATAATADAVGLLTVPAFTVVQVVATQVLESFEDISDVAFNATVLEVGDSGDADRLLVSQQLNENGSTVLGKAGVAGGFVYTAATPLLATFGSMAAKSLVNIDKGKVRIFLKIVELNTLHGA